MTFHTEELSIILMRKLQTYAEFHSVTGLLRNALECEEMTAVNQCIDRREELVREIDGLDRRIDHHRRFASLDQSRAIARLLSEMSVKLSEQLRRIIADDRDCTALVEQRRDETRKELAAIRHQKEGFHGYALKPPRMPKFLNVRT